MTGVLFGGAAPIGSGTYSAATGSVGTPGLAFTVSSTLTLNGIWAWTSGARASLPTGIAIFSGTSSTALASVASGAVWYTSPGGATASATASGWIYSPFSSPVTLTSGNTYHAGPFSAATNYWFDYQSPGQWPAAAVSGVTATSAISQQGYANTSTAAPANPALGTSYGFAFGIDLEIAAAGNTVTVTNPGSQTGTVSTAITGLQIVASDSASLALTFTASGLPAGLSISSSGLITGTPTTASTYSVVVTATDSTTAHGSAAFSWVISSAGTGWTLVTTPVTAPLPAHDLNPKVELLLQQAQTWLDISGRVFYDTVTLSRGGPDESTQTTAAQFSGTLDNHDGYLSTLNPRSPYYGQLGLNTQIRVSVPDASSALVCEGVNADYASATLFSTAYSANPFEIWIDLDADNWYAQSYLCGQWDTGNQGTSSWYLQSNFGQLELVVNSSSGGSYHAYPFSYVMPAHGRISLRLSVTPSTGTAVLYTGNYLGSWVNQGTLSYGTSVPVYSTTQQVRVGNVIDSAGYNQGFQGKVYGFALLNAVNGTIAANSLTNPSFAQTTPGVTSFNDTTGTTWTMGGTALISNRNYRFFGECSAWPQSWSVGDPNARVTITASGLLRRQGQTNIPIQSPLKRAYTRELISIGGPPPVSYWPMEDLSAATTLASAVGQGSLQLGGAVNVSSNSQITGSAPLPQVNSGWITGQVPFYTPGNTSGNGSIIRWVYAQDSTGEANNTTIATFWFNGGTVGAVNFIQTSANGMQINAYDTGGNVINTVTPMWSPNTGSIAGWAGQISLEVQVSPTTGQYVVYVVWYRIGDPSAYTNTLVASSAGTVGRLTGFRLGNNQLPQPSHSAYGHLTVQTSWVSLYNMAQAIQGYPGEAAGIRFQRLCAEEGINFRSMGVLSTTQAMGTQSIDTLPNLLQECIDAEQGIWYETRQCLGWGFRTNNSLMNQHAGVILDYNQDHLSGTLDPTIDDQIVKNDVTIQSTQGGSSSRMVLTDGTVSSVGVMGRYDTSISVNVANSVLPYVAAWVLWSLSRPDPRYTSISVDLANSALLDLYYQIMRLEVGDRVQIVNPPVWLPPGQVDQVIKGLNETISAKAFSVAYNTVPASQYLALQLNSLVYGVLDSGNAFIANTGATSTATSIPVSMPNATPLWSSATPYNIMCNGEEMTVTAVSALVSGVQTLTVTRGVNGVQVALPAAAPVHSYPAVVPIY